MVVKTAEQLSNTVRENVEYRIGLAACRPMPGDIVELVAKLASAVAFHEKRCPIGGTHNPKYVALEVLRLQLNKRNRKMLRDGKAECHKAFALSEDAA